ncbi:MAG: hypothetical protein U1F53_08245 [Burkholderiaceae bacterium]
MNATTPARPPSPVLQRLALFTLLVALPVVVVATQWAALFGPLHTHDPALGPAHQHARGGLQRHWHLPGDHSLVVIGGSGTAAASGGQPRARAMLPLAPPVAWSLPWRRDLAQARPAEPGRVWLSPDLPPPERPPRA